MGKVWKLSHFKRGFQSNFFLELHERDVSIYIDFCLDIICIIVMGGCSLNGIGQFLVLNLHLQFAFDRIPKRMRLPQLSLFPIHSIEDRAHYFRFSNA